MENKSETNSESNNSTIDSSDSKLETPTEVAAGKVKVGSFESEKKTGFMTTLKHPIKSFRSLSKNAKLAIILSTVLILVGFTAFGLTRSNSGELSSESSITEQDTPQEIKIKAKLTLKEGTVEVKLPENSEWNDVTTDTELSEGSSIRTVGATSRTVVTFENGSELRLDANSEAELESLSTSRLVIKHNSGYTYNRVIQIEGSKFVVTTKDAQYEALGTAFKTAATGDEQSLEVYQSSVVETNLNKTAKTGEKLTVKDKTAPSNDGKVEKLDIEEVKNDPFMQWNRELDEKNDLFKKELGFLSDVTAPEINLTTSDGEVIFLEPNATEGTIEISGTTEAGAKVTVQSKSVTGSTPIEVTVGTDGKFTTPVLSAPIGNSVFEFIAKDKNGNTTTKSLRVTFQKKSQPVGNATSFVLTGTENSSNQKVELSWTFKSIEAPDGVKLVYSKSTDPVYSNPMPDGVKYKYVESGTSSYIKYSEFTNGSGVYYIKACIYDKASGTCGQYSNQVTVTIP